MNVLDFIQENKVITIVRRVYGEDVEKLAAALLKGGLRLMEVTFDQADPDCLEKTAETISMLNKVFDGEMLFGAGTVLSEEQVKAAKQAGGAYIISPNISEKVIKMTKALDMVSIPGAMTPTEIITGHELGGDIIKLFPAGYLGFRYIKDILAPISHVKLCATGGVTEETWGQYLDLGFAGAGISGRLCDKKCIAAGDWDEITRRAAAFSEITKQHA